MGLDTTERPYWYGLDEQPCSIAQANALLADIGARRVARSVRYRRGRRMELSTVHLVLDHAFAADAPFPLLYESMWFIDGQGETVERWPTREMARLGARDGRRRTRPGEAPARRRRPVLGPCPGRRRAARAPAPVLARGRR